MFGMRVETAEDDGYGNLIVTGASTGVCVPNQTLQWIGSRGIDRAVVDFSITDRLILRKAAGSSAVPGVLLLDA